MSPWHFAATAAGLAFVLWRGRAIPLDGARRTAALVGRAAALVGLCVALFGPPRRHATEVSRDVVYLVDGSASIDAAQRAWIARRIASLEASRPASVERLLAAFGGDVQLVAPRSGERLADPDAIERLLDRAPVLRDRSNVESALLAVPGLLPPHHRAAVVLFTDGQETAGSVSRVLRALDRLGLEVFPVPVPGTSAAGAVWEALVVPPVVRQGAPVGIQLVLRSSAGADQLGEVSVSIQGVPISRRAIRVRQGSRVYQVTVPAIARGTLALEVDLSIPSAGIDERRRAYTEVEGPPRLLMVSEQPTAFPALAEALRRREIDVAMARPADLSDAPERLLDYDGVVLFNLPWSAVPPPAARAVRTYVEALGGGLMSIGLGGELAEELAHATPLEPLLPLRFEPKGLQESKRRVCIILLVDRSASMMGPRMAATKRAAVALVNQLAPDDLVGILAFDTQPYVVAEVQQAGQVGAWLVEKLVKLRSSGGTDILPALEAAANRLQLTGATVKHIILLSDGNTPFPEDAYESLVGSFRLSGTTVSTIGIGSAFINEGYLEWLARSTGGIFYQLQRLEDLPQLIAHDTEQTLGRLPFAEGRFVPRRAAASEWFEELAAWPPLRGYLTTTAKPGAQLELSVEGGSGEEPLLARWHVGKGRVVAFASDADVRWSPEWIRWPGFEGVWAQAARWTMRPRLTEELFVWIDETSGAPHLVLEGELRDPKAALAFEGEGAPTPIPLVQTGLWRWRAPLDQLPSGWHQLLLESTVPAGGHLTTVLTRRWVEIGTAPAVDEQPGQPAREPLLRQVARATSGAYEAPDLALLPASASVQVLAPPALWWLPLVILALLLDVAARGGTML